MAISPSTDGGVIIQLDDEIDGEDIGSRNYRFSKIGEPVPIYSNASQFAPECLPSQPLAVSERFRLLFVAHPHGFCVAKTADVMASAEQIEDKESSPSLLEFCLVDVSLESVSILALSADDSMLAATVGSRAYFFAVSALLHKESKPSFSVSLDDSSCIKDMRWARKAANVFLILSVSGKLYYGSGQGPLSHVAESVDSVDWSIRGNFVAVAKKNILSILSSQLKEKLSFLLPFRSVIGDSDVNQLIKVDSVRWIRPDCIVVGFFQLNDDGEEENYVVQIITSREGRITDPASKPIVLSFNSVFMDFCSDAVPTRNGPHLFVSYLDLHGLAFVANRNLSRRIGLFCWPLDSGKNEAAMVEILYDAWNLYIENQGNGEENVILGLSVDKVAQNENVKFTLGDEDTEVSPSCVIICLTIDGKISVFHFASAVGASSPKYVASDEEDDAPQVPSKHELSQISSGGVEGSGKQIFSKSESHELSRIEMEKTDAKATVTNDLSYSFQVNIQSREKTDTENVGQKSLANSQSLKLDGPTRTLSVASSQNCNEENQFVSKVKSSTSFFSGKVVDDIPSESVRNFLSADRNVEPLVKVESENSPSTWSLTWSNGAVDTSKTPVGRSFSLPFDKVDGSARAILRDSSDVRENAKSSATSSSFGQNASTELGIMHSLLSNPVSQVPLRENVAPGKSLKSESSKDSFATSSLNGLPYYMQNTAKQFGNVEDMAKKLDILLKEIEGKGGFTDASITSQENLVIELENDMWALSSRYPFWRGLMDKQLREVQLLLDKTTQVLVRKVYLEGIFKQDSDSKYWELWNRQNLSSELDLKRRHILNLNQELINQMIELERHFNLLEFNKFGEDGATQRNWKASQNWHRHSRQIQPLHSLHYTMNAQLSAAEQLSECLSRQMAVLSIESNGKEHDVKKKLFESIGLSYGGDAHRSPARDETFGTPAIEEQFRNSYSVTAKEQSRRDQASIAQSYQLETARRHRDSLDQDWTSFEPSKTTVKRMLLKENYEKGTANRSSLNIDKQYLTPQSQTKLEVANSALLNTPASYLNLSQSKGTAEILAKQSNEITSTSLFQRKAGILDREIQGSYSALPPPSILEATMTRNSELGSSTKLTDEKLKSNVPLIGRTYFFASESEVVPQSDTSFHLTSPADSIGSLDHSKIGFTKSSTGNLKNTRIVTDNVSESKIPSTPASAFSSTPNLSEKGLFAKNMGKPSQNVNDVSASTSMHSILDSSLPSRNILPSLSSFVSKPSAPTLFPATPSSLEANVVRKQEVPRPQTSAPSIMSFASTLSLASPESNLSSVSFSSPFVKSESLKSSSYSPDPISGLKNENNSQMQTLVATMLSTTEMNFKIQGSPSQPALTTEDSKLEPSASSALTEFSNNLKSGSEMVFGGSLKNSLNVSPMFKSDKPNAVESLSPVAISSSGIVGSVKNVPPDDASQEEEMEEEVSETDQTTELALGNLGGFGIGSTPNSTSRKPNPFGVVTLDKDMTSVTSSFTMSTPSGELFRPASFSFQPPQPPKPLHPTAVSFSGGFSTGNPGQVSAVSGFGQPAHIGSGQQALGSVLGTFGQSRQLGTGLTGSNVAANGFGSGFMGMAAGDFGGGFASASTAGGLASASTAGGFASLAAGGGGFASAAIAGGQFAVAAASSGGGFPSAANGASFAGGGFGAFSNQQGSEVLSAFGGGSGTGRPPSELFTQMRK